MTGWNDLNSLRITLDRWISQWWKSASGREKSDFSINIGIMWKVSLYCISSKSVDTFSIDTASIDTASSPDAYMIIILPQPMRSKEKFLNFYQNYNRLASPPQWISWPLNFLMYYIYFISRYREIEISRKTIYYIVEQLITEMLDFTGKIAILITTFSRLVYFNTQTFL